MTKDYGFSHLGYSANTVRKGKSCIKNKYKQTATPQITQLVQTTEQITEQLVLTAWIFKIYDNNNINHQVDTLTCSWDKPVLNQQPSNY